MKSTSVQNLEECLSLNVYLPVEGAFDRVGKVLERVAV